MVTRLYDMIGSGRLTPMPISAVIQAANLFGCDIYIRTEQKRINVKNYEELQRGIQPQRRHLVFSFSSVPSKQNTRCRLGGWIPL